MNHFLDNPVFYALCSGDAQLGRGTDHVKFFDEGVSPFVGFDNNYKDGFSELGRLLPPGRMILYATRERIKEPIGWHLMHEIAGLQFVYEGNFSPPNFQFTLQLLDGNNVDEMIALARLTKPGPFDKRTIDFGHYYGIFENNKLAAMTGQRLHPGNYTEISAVCTHPESLGKGYAAALIQKQLEIILQGGNKPFLHVRDDNDRAIALYKRLGFLENGAMNFYFMKKS